MDSTIIIILSCGKTVLFFICAYNILLIDNKWTLECSWPHDVKRILWCLDFFFLYFSGIKYATTCSSSFHVRHNFLAFRYLIRQTAERDTWTANNSVGMTFFCCHVFLQTFDRNNRFYILATVIWHVYMFKGQELNM